MRCCCNAQRDATVNRPVTSKKVKNMNHDVNPYLNQMTDKDIENQVHRGFVGGLWDTLGQLQFDFITRQGLQPSDKLLDMGCGCFRGGIHFIRYLDNQHYYGLDINQSLINAGNLELAQAGISDKQPNTLVSDCFDATPFNQTFKFILSISLFTHLNFNLVLLCLKQIKRVLDKDGRYFSTVFLAPDNGYSGQLTFANGEITTHYLQDPYHISMAEISALAKLAGLKVEQIVEGWNHPRQQSMLVFTHHN
jgi:cyclopropane fatty-acyl-phospholipid synthase-like methyltransferase